MLMKILAVVIIAGVLISWLGVYSLIIPAVLLLLWLIRKVADIFWWGRDNGKW